MRRLYKKCPKLTDLDLSNCVGISEDEVQLMMTKFGHQLVKLNMSGCRIDENCLKIIIKDAQKLQYLNIENNFWRLKGECLKDISHSIKYFVTDYSDNVRSIEGLVKGSGQNITHLKVNVSCCGNSIQPYNLIGNVYFT